MPTPRIFVFLACCLATLPAVGLRAAVPEPMPAKSILEELRSFRVMGTVLMIAAHPDDENTQLIAYLSRGRNYRMGYLSITRGDGGQNEIGPELGAELGVARTQELLAARRVDGGRQFFTRALDFGYSKTPTETLAIWDRQQVLGDVVRVIRTFRPDVLVTRFSPLPANTHGHHTASAILGAEAFKLAGDPKAFPEQIAQGLAPWQPKRIFMNSGGFGRGGAAGGNPAGVLRVDVGGSDPVSGESFSLIAARSRGMHKTQGFGVNGALSGRSGPQLETFQLLDGEPAAMDIMDGIDTTWGRVAGGAGVGQFADDVLNKFNLQDPAASVPALLDLKAKLAALPADTVLDEKRQQLDRILQACLGLSVQTTIAQAEVVPGEALKMHHVVRIQSAVPVRWAGVRYPSVHGETPSAIAGKLTPAQEASCEAAVVLPLDTPVSQPYWLREPGTPGMFRVDDAALIGRPENPPTFPVELVFEVGGQTLVVPDQPVQVTVNAAKVETQRRLDVIPPVTLHFATDVQLFAPGASRPVEIEVTANRAAAGGQLRLVAPAGWKVAPATQAFRLKAVGDKATLAFTVTATTEPGTVGITADATVNGERVVTDRYEIRYAHIPLQLLQPTARVTAVSLNLAIRGRKVGYLPGAGDEVGECLAQMGYAVTTLAGADLTPEKLRGLDAVVIGVRAFNERTDFAANLPGLFAYVEAGGTVIAQYNRPDRLATTKLGPYDLSIAGDAPSHRVTDENAPVTFLVPGHAALTTPNRIGPADFEGWVQERGTYFPSKWDKEHYTEVLAMSDPGEAPLTSSLLVAQYGRGNFVYTGLTFFRQLPAGVPGAYRLLANLVSLGK